MNKKVWALAIVLILIAAGWYYMKNKNVTSTSSTTNPTATTQPATTATLRDLIAKGVAQSCTFNTEKTNGSVYVAGKSVRGDFDTTIDTTVMKAHMIVKDNTSYIWTDGKSVGIKTSFDPSATPAATSSTSTSGSFDAGVNMNYKCSAWITDNSKFDLPAGVTFSTFAMPSNAAPATGATTGTSKSSQCAYCDNLSGDNKTQCLSALNCN